MSIQYLHRNSAYIPRKFSLVKRTTIGVFLCYFGCCLSPRTGFPKLTSWLLVLPGTHRPFLRSYIQTCDEPDVLSSNGIHPAFRLYYEYNVPLSQKYSKTSISNNNNNNGAFFLCGRRIHLSPGFHYLLYSIQPHRKKDGKEIALRACLQRRQKESCLRSPGRRLVCTPQSSV